MKPRDYLADTATPMSLRAFLEAALAAQTTVLPELYATTNRAFSGRGDGGFNHTHQHRRQGAGDGCGSVRRYRLPTFSTSRKLTRRGLV